MPKYKNIQILIGGDFYKRYPVTNICDNSYEYQDESCINKITLIDEEIEFVRENDEFLLIMNNTKDMAFYKLKEQNYELEIKINYFDARKENNKLIISYQLETTDKEISLILESED